MHAEDVAGAFDLTPFSLEHMTISTKMSEHYNYGTRIHLDERNDGLVHEGFKHTELEADTQQTACNQRRVFLVDVLARRLAGFAFCRVEQIGTEPAQLVIARGTA